MYTEYTNPSEYRTHEIHHNGEVFPDLLVRRCSSMEDLLRTLAHPGAVPTDGTITIKKRATKDGTIFYYLKIVYTLPPELRMYHRRCPNMPK